MEYKDLFSYNDIKIEDKIKFSPSMFGTFYENPKSWYKKNILKEDSFTGNTNTVIGTILHSRVGAYWKGIPIDEDVEANYLANYETSAEVNDWKVYEAVTSLWNIAPEHIVQMDKPTHIEESVCFEIPNTEYYIAGTYDYAYLDDRCKLGDLKTSSTNPKSIKVSHRIQLLLYALALKHSKGITIKEIEVTYFVKTKTPKITTLVEPIGEYDYNYIKKEVVNMIKRLDLVKKDKELEQVLFFNNSNSYIK